MKKPYYIYLLICPLSQKVRYVGCSKNPKARYSSHIRESIQRQNTRKKEWINSLIKKGLKPKQQIINELYTAEESRQAEQIAVEKYIETIYNIHSPKKGAKDIKKPNGERTKENTN